MATPVYNNQTLAEQEKRRRFGVTIEQPSLQGLRDASGGENPYANEPTTDELLAEAKHTLDATGGTQAELNAAAHGPNPKLTVGKAPSRFGEAMRGIGRSIAAQPAVQALSTPLGQQMAFSLLGPARAGVQAFRGARLAASRAPWREATEQIIRPSMRTPAASLEGLRQASRPDSYTRFIRQLAQEGLEETPGIGNPLMRNLGEQLPIEEGPRDLLSRWVIAKNLGLSRPLAGLTGQ